MRERTKGENFDVQDTLFSNYLTEGTCVNPDPDPVVTDYPYTNIGISDSRVMHDIVTPNWRECQKLGIIINNPMDSTRHITRSSIATIDIDSHLRYLVYCGASPTWLYGRSRYLGTIPSATFISGKGIDYLEAPALSADSLVARAVHKAWARQELTSAQTLVMAAELAETIVSLQALFRSLYRLTKLVVRDDIPKLIKEFNFLSGTKVSEKYMFARYALRPLVYDVLSCIEALNGKTKGVGERFTSRGSVEETNTIEDEVPWEFNNTSGGEIDHQEMTFLRKSSKTVHASAGVLSLITALSKLNTWGLDQPLEAIWEVIPFSFVIDWFCDIGTTIAAFTPEYGLRPLTSWSVVTTTTHQSITVTEASRSVTPGPAGELLHAGYRVENCTLSYTKIEKIRAPEPRRTILPKFHVKLDGWKVYDLAIMLRQLAGRMR